MLFIIFSGLLFIHIHIHFVRMESLQAGRVLGVNVDELVLVLLGALHRDDLLLLEHRAGRCQRR